MLATTYSGAVPRAWGLSGGFGAFDVDIDFQCRQNDNYICRPAGPNKIAVDDQVTEMQRAIDIMLADLPLFRKKIAAPDGTVEQISTLKAIGDTVHGYDGRIGPLTTAAGTIALIGALDLVRAARSTLEAPVTIVKTVQSFLSEINRTQVFAKFAPEITNFLQTVLANFESLLEEVRQTTTPEDRAVLLEAPIPVPKDVSEILKPEKPFPWGLTIAGIATAALLGGLTIYLVRVK